MVPPGALVVDLGQSLDGILDAISITITLCLDRVESLSIKNHCTIRLALKLSIDDRLKLSVSIDLNLSLKFRLSLSINISVSIHISLSIVISLRIIIKLTVDLSMHFRFRPPNHPFSLC